MPHAFWLYLLHLLLLHEHLVNCLSAVGDATLADMFAVMNGFKENQSRCYSFDVRASGFVASEGCVAVAISSGREGPVNNTARLLSSVALCAGESASLTAPNRDSQTMLLRQAWHKAGQEPEVVEAHGSGTALGDPIEVQAILRSLTKDDGRLCIGALKAHVGHMCVPIARPHAPTSCSPHAHRSCTHCMLTCVH